MQWYDLLMFAVLAGTTIFGFMKGMAWQIASLASLVASYFVALRFSEPLVATGLFGDEEPWNRFVAMLAIYVVTSLIIWLGFRLVSRAIDRVRLQEFDRQIGGLFGLAKGILLCVAITFFAVTLVPDTRDAILRSRSGHYIAVLIAKADAVMPHEVHEVLDPYLDRLGEELNGHKTPSPDSATDDVVPSDRASSPPKSAPAIPSGAGPLLGNPRGASTGAGGAEASAAASQASGKPAIGTRLVQPWTASPGR